MNKVQCILGWLVMLFAGCQLFADFDFENDEFWVNDSTFWIDRSGSERMNQEAWDQARAYWLESEKVIERPDVSNRDVAYLIVHAATKPHVRTGGAFGAREQRLAVPIQLAIIDGRLERDEIHSMIMVLEEFHCSEEVRYFSRVLKDLLVTIEDGVVEIGEPISDVSAYRSAEVINDRLKAEDAGN